MINELVAIPLSELKALSSPKTWKINNFCIIHTVIISGIIEIIPVSIYLLKLFILKSINF